MSWYSHPRLRKVQPKSANEHTVNKLLWEVSRSTLIQLADRGVSCDTFNIHFIVITMPTELTHINTSVCDRATKMGDVAPVLYIV
jgi:hypothetical protein